MIKKIQAESGAKVQFQQGREDGPGDRKCLLSGKHQAVEQARQRIQELIDSVMVHIMLKSKSNEFILYEIRIYIFLLIIIQYNFRQFIINISIEKGINFELFLYF